MLIKNYLFQKFLVVWDDESRNLRIKPAKQLNTGSERKRKSHVLHQKLGVKTNSGKID